MGDWELKALFAGMLATLILGLAGFCDETPSDCAPDGSCYDPSEIDNP